MRFITTLPTQSHLQYTCTLINDYTHRARNNGWPLAIFQANSWLDRAFHKMLCRCGLDKQPVLTDEWPTKLEYARTWDIIISSSVPIICIWPHPLQSLFLLTCIIWAKTRQQLVSDVFVNIHFSCMNLKDMGASLWSK